MTITLSTQETWKFLYLLAGMEPTAPDLEELRGQLHRATTKALLEASPLIQPGMIVNSKFGVGVVREGNGDGRLFVVTERGGCQVLPENHVQPITAQCRNGRFAFAASPAQDTKRPVSRFAEGVDF